MKLVFIYGKPATGKLTVARELAALTGYKLFHNHQTVDLLLSVFEFGSPPFVELREQIWLSVFEQAAKARLNGLIFTFAPETTVRKTFVDRAIDIVAGAGSRVHFVELTCPMKEVYRRIDNKSRRNTGKLTSHEEYERLEAAGVFNTAHMPKADLTVDTAKLKPAEAAQQIAKGLSLPRVTA
ncbi:AAA family ATPase [Ferrovibrio sp.]|jgi:hypothetical protein|uniref:AAA family ATPase n=1 Tax=Ferrovibrio sp. TaxID=1917215 RepID=UPI0035ADED4A